MTPTIAVFGSSQTLPDTPAWQTAMQTGAILARKGYRVINGGYGGVMEASSQGARQAGGEVTGITCEAFTTRATGNPHLTEEILTPTLLERITTLLQRADGFIVLDGGVGTLAELFLAWNLLVLGDPRPLIVLGDSLRLAIESLGGYTELREKYIALLAFVATPEEAVERIDATLQCNKRKQVYD